MMRGGASRNLEIARDSSSARGYDGLRLRRKTHTDRQVVKTSTAASGNGLYISMCSVHTEHTTDGSSVDK